MYETHFGFSEAPFSIAPNPRYLYMSGKHREAMAHLLYGIREGGGFVQLTGEVGTGKTTLCRQLLAEIPDGVDVALILNPRIDERELMQSICDELRINYRGSDSVKQLVDVLNDHLLQAHARGRHTVLVIDEAQNLTDGVLEQVRLLTNLETARKKLLQIILIGQPELKEHLAGRALRQLSQRITARYHLEPLNRREVREYLRYRLRQGGCERPLFTAMAVSAIYRHSRGVPRLINVLCDRALLGAYASGRGRVSRRIVARASRELRGGASSTGRRVLVWGVAAMLALVAPLAAYTMGWLPERVDREVRQFVPSWVPRLSTAERVVGSGLSKAGFIRVAHAAQPPMPALSLELDLSVDARPHALTGEQPSPVRLSSIARLTAVEARDVIASLGGESGSRVHALRELAAMWSVPLALVFDCVGIGEFGLSCHSEVGGWSRVLELDRPAVVVLQGAGETSGHGVLRHVIAEEVVVGIGGADYRMAVDEFTEVWAGSALLLWRRPPLGQIPVNEASSREDVLWLRRALNLEAANYGGVIPSRVERDLFDAELRDVLHDFQRRLGLPVSDQAAAAELILLNGRLGYESHPVLRHR
jgi:general secretion pathway protein A